MRYRVPLPRKGETDWFRRRFLAWLDAIYIGRQIKWQMIFLPGYDCFPEELCLKEFVHSSEMQVWLNLFVQISPTCGRIHTSIYDELLPFKMANEASEHSNYPFLIQKDHCSITMTTKRSFHCSWMALLIVGQSLHRQYLPPLKHCVCVCLCWNLSCNWYQLKSIIDGRLTLIEYLWCCSYCGHLTH